MSLTELKKLIGNKKLIVGTDRTLKELKKGNIKSIFVASNCPENLKSEIETNARMEKSEISVLEINNEELGVVVKKPFAVSVVSLLK
ncbi:ribosomal L7Ae/L30e/S12e/Gadd45 family protein [Candidatus Woesearchaeota archaeon]|nr:ribosomal L7Ae/L30e/S12e/Gadd45 family protein [Candidatus Woesearchaeota archaeon]